MSKKNNNKFDTRLLGKSGEQYFGVRCKKCGKVCLLPYRSKKYPDGYNPKRARTTRIECDGCGHSEVYLPKDFDVYDYSIDH